jgi:AcrR family transcriptional regulator
MPAGYEDVGRTAQKRRTRSALTDAAAELIAAGQRPTVAEAALAAGVSKSTAYRYFPSQEILYSYVVLNQTVGPDREHLVEAAQSAEDPARRLDRLVQADHAFSVKHEHALRAGLRAFLLLIESFPDTPLEPSTRVRHLTIALEPLAGQLPGELHSRLVAALALCVGTEASLVTQVNCGLSEQDAEAVKRWAAATLLRAALDQPSGLAP